MRSADIEAALLQIREDNDGILTARVIVEAAADEEHPLHGEFEWDDSIAGPRYRIQQARRLVRVVRLKYIDNRGEPEEIRVFHSLPNPGSRTGRAYIPLEEIQRSQELTKQLERQMEFEWRAVWRKWRQFSQFIKMVRRDMPDEPDDEADEPLAVGNGG